MFKGGDELFSARGLLSPGGGVLIAGLRVLNLQSLAAKLLAPTDQSVLIRIGRDRDRMELVIFWC